MSRRDDGTGSRPLGVSYKRAFVFPHKLRKAMAVELKGRVVGGVGKTVEVDDGCLGSYIKPAIHKANRVDRHLARNQNGKRECVVIVRERGGNSVPAVFRTEGAALSFIKARVAKGTVIQADEAASWDALHAHCEVKRMNHRDAYSDDGACTDMDEEYFSHLRRAEQGHHHHIAGVYLLRYAQEASWREDRRREAKGTQYERIAGLAMKRGPSVEFCGYRQRHRSVAA
ncbi:IS1595 family transposase [Methylobacterium sp. CM6247]